MDNGKTFDFWRNLDYPLNLTPSPASLLPSKLSPANYASLLSRFCQGLNTSVRRLNSAPPLSLPPPHITPGLWARDEGETPLDLSRTRQQQQTTQNFHPPSLLSHSPLDWAILESQRSALLASFTNALSLLQAGTSGPQERGPSERHTFLPPSRLVSKFRMSLSTSARLDITTLPPPPPQLSPLPPKRGHKGAQGTTMMTAMTSTPTGKSPVSRCFECKALFPSLRELNAHFLHEHHATLQREFAQNRSWKSCSLESVCVQELQVTHRKGSLGRTGYPCPHCEYFAKWPTELQKHIMVHSKERPHQCVICGLTYKWKWDLGRHFDKSHHHAVNPYKKTGIARGMGKFSGTRRRTCEASASNKASTTAPPGLVKRGARGRPKRLRQPVAELRHPLSKQKDTESSYYMDMIETKQETVAHFSTRQANEKLPPSFMLPLSSAPLGPAALSPAEILLQHNISLARMVHNEARPNGGR
ncbi:unnamed protein product [Schistocephalus solidus]|uniref:C2H2-type domain-containing protein n=1 Tax=Schistocephalus solidus TaxID=70667 RepID=A0A183TCW8_SCHSO|nr:unnamed protein product [Schistocephalus solidus]